MADSKITKKNLADALKELLNEVPFEKISVSDICEKCNMNRKSFYYHFKDKYDLLNRIFDTEFALYVKRLKITSLKEFISALVLYLFNNGDFYRKAFEVSGQNSFGEHLRNRLFTIISMYTDKDCTDRPQSAFKAKFYADAIVCTAERHLASKEPQSLEELCLYICNAMNI